MASREQADAWIAYEAILNQAFAHRPLLAETAGVPGDTARVACGRCRRARM